MKPHRFDPLSFAFGALFLGATVMASTGTLDVGGRTFTWIGAGLLLLSGVLMLAGSRGGDRKRLRSTDDED
jgi:hypothetical protein